MAPDLPPRECWEEEEEEVKVVEEVRVVEEEVKVVEKEEEEVWDAVVGEEVDTGRKKSGYGESDWEKGRRGKKYDVYCSRERKSAGLVGEEEDVWGIRLWGIGGTRVQWGGGLGGRKGRKTGEWKENEENPDT